MNIAPWLVGSAALLTLGACSGPAGQEGTVLGTLPLCYGPGPNTNLLPLVTIRTYREGRLASENSFRADREAHRTYELRLPPGRYELRTEGLQRSVAVRAGQQTRADFFLACL